MLIGTLVLPKEAWAVSGINYGVGLVVDWNDSWDSSLVLWAHGEVQWWPPDELKLPVFDK